MKSLKKTLSLVLVLVMVLGMFGVASAFTDDATIQYKEAVEVMTGIKAIAGFPDGSFGPTKTITRAEAAKMVTFTVLGADIAGTLTGVNSSFTDVPANPYGWAIPSIEYLVKEGVVSGVGGGKFNPAGEVSALEVGKMLLCALGYGAKDEYVGEGWALAVAIDGAKYGIFTGRAATASDLDKPATREEVALYCFNALSIQKVSYSALTDQYNLVTHTVPPSTALIPTTITTDVYPTLQKTSATVDVFGRPASAQWEYKNNVISTIFTAKPIATYTTAVSQHTLYTVTGAGTISGLRSSLTGGAVAQSFVAARNETGKYIDDTTSTATNGNGVITEVYKIANTGAATDYKIVQIVPSLSTVSNVKTVPASPFAGAYTEYTIEGVNYKVFSSVVDSTQDIDGAVIKGAVSKGSKVIVYKDSKGVIYVEPLTTMQGTLTAVNGTTGALTIDGKTYSKAAYGAAVTPNKDAQTFLVDSFGNIVESISALPSGVTYGLALQTKTMLSQGSDGSLTQVPTVIVAAADGTIVSLPVADYSAVSTAINLGGSQKGVLVSYKPATGGAYTVDVITANDPALAKVTAITKGTNALTATTMADGVRADTLYADAQTLFVVANFDAAGKLTGTVATYTGINNVPTFSGLTDTYAVDTNYVATLVATDNVANVVFIGKNTTSGTSAQMVYVTGNYNTTVSGKVYDVIINGQPDVITIDKAESLTKGLYAGISVNSAGVPTVTGTELLIASTKTGFRASGGLLYTTTDNTAWAVDTVTNAADTTPVFVINGATGTCTTTTAGALGEITYAKVFVAPSGTSGAAATTAAAIYVLS